ncbi:MAG: TIR domain-containing protein [candidate division KSB1 bacterium]|nr:TIR domain-containing protein [candidate division KSB1 bacterium]
MDKPRIFISHTWEAEDNALTHRLEKVLRDTGAEVWVDHAGIRPGDSLPKQINDALGWCNILVLVWSKAAKDSHWVELEWFNALTLRKRIIPCLIDDIPLPPILAHLAYIDFSNEAQGLRQLLAALQLEPPRREAQEPAASPEDEPKPAPTPPRPTIIQLRHTRVDPLSVEAVQRMLRQKDFFNKYWNESGKGIRHQYERAERRGAKLVIDHATGLTWQQGGSESYMSFKAAEAYIQQLNAQKFGGYTDWRLPTLEEAMSLMEPRQYGELYLDPIFDRKQWWIWTSDKESAGRAWYVHFIFGHCDPYAIGDSLCVRAVRS